MSASHHHGTVNGDDSSYAQPVSPSSSAASHAVLLYYQYVHVDDEVAAADWMREICEQQGLLGRVRVSKQGFNVTVAGPSPGIHAHVASLQNHPRQWFATCDFKLAPCLWPPPPRIARECGLASLSVRTVKELVTLTPHHHLDLSHSGPHLSPQDFHALLDKHSCLSPESADQESESVQASVLGCQNECVKGVEGDVAKVELLPPRMETCLHDVEKGRVGEFVTAEGREVHSIECSAHSEHAHPSAEPEGTTEQQLSCSIQPEPLLLQQQEQLELQQKTEQEQQQEEEEEEQQQQQQQQQHAEEQIVVIDTRNVYETRVGRFCPPSGVIFLEPHIRQFSDLPAWLDDKEDELRGKTVLMYCTGGVRCESASAYLRSKGPGFSHVYQLAGGIVRYLDAFPDGGYFCGKNFVFDHRLAVPSNDPSVIGRCHVCSCPFDDYSARQRCEQCRLLLLVCPACEAEDKAQARQAPLLCELCSAGSSSTNHKPADGAADQSQPHDLTQRPTSRSSSHATGSRTQ